MHRLFDLTLNILLKSLNKYSTKLAKIENHKKKKSSIKKNTLNNSFRDIELQTIKKINFRDAENK